MSRLSEGNRARWQRYFRRPISGWSPRLGYAPLQREIGAIFKRSSTALSTAFHRRGLLSVGCVPKPNCRTFFFTETSSDVTRSEGSESKTPWLHLTKAAALTIAPLALIGFVAETIEAAVMAAPAFLLLYAIEAYRVLRTPPKGSLQWLGITLLVPLAFAVPIAVSMRLDPTVPQGAMIALPSVLPVLTLVGCAVLTGADRRLCTRPPTARWAGLSVLGLVLGGVLPAVLFVRGQIQEARVQKARQAVLKRALSLEDQWSLNMRISEVSGDDGHAMVRIPNAIQVVDPSGQRTRSVPLTQPVLPSLDTGPLYADPAPEFIVYGKGFNDTLRAFDDDGRPLWSYATSQGTPGSVALTDLNADGHAEVATGSTTGGGLRLLSSSGQVLWTDTTLWVSDVAAWPPTKKDSAVVVASTGETLEFYRRGTHIRSVRPGVSTRGFALRTDSPEGSPALFVGANGPTLVAYLRRGAEQWRRPLPASVARLSAKGRFLAAVGGDQNRIYVFESESGRPVAASDTA